MTALKSFLDWFEGFADNIDDKPSAKQWGKIRERIERLRTELGSEPAQPATVAATVSIPAADVDPNPAGTATTAKWKQRVKAALEEAGFDADSADEVIRGPGFIVDLNAEPAAVAARFANGA